MPQFKIPKLIPPKSFIKRVKTFKHGFYRGRRALRNARFHQKWSRVYLDKVEKKLGQKIKRFRKRRKLKDGVGFQGKSKILDNHPTPPAARGHETKKGLGFEGYSG